MTQEELLKKYKLEMLSLESYLDNNKVMYSNDKIIVIGTQGEHGICKIEFVDQLIWKLEDIKIKHNSSYSQEELIECLLDALKSVCNLSDSDDFKNKDNVKIFTSVGHVSNNGIDYQAQIVLTPCKLLWTDDGEVCTMEVDGIKIK